MRISDWSSDVCSSDLRNHSRNDAGSDAMTWKNTADRWGPVSQLLHWLIVLLVLVLAIVGLTMGELPKTPKYFWVYTMQKSTGITVRFGRTSCRERGCQYV